MTFFHTTHSIPDSLGIVFHTSEGAIVHTGEFKFDQSAKGKYRPDIAKMAAFGEEGVFILMSDSYEAERPGYTTSESVIETVCPIHFIAWKAVFLLPCMLLISSEFSKFSIKRSKRVKK